MTSRDARPSVHTITTDEHRAFLDDDTLCLEFLRRRNHKVRDVRVDGRQAEVESDHGRFVQPEHVDRLRAVGRGDDAIAVRVRDGNIFDVGRLDADLGELDHWAGLFLDKLKAIPSVADVTTDQLNAGPMLDITIKRDVASSYGILPYTIDNTLDDAFGQRIVSTMFTTLNQYHVVLEVEPTAALIAALGLFAAGFAFRFCDCAFASSYSRCEIAFLLSKESSVCRSSGLSGMRSW